MKFRVLAADHHRNGVGGAPFYVGLIYDYEEKRELLITWFPEYVDSDREVLAKFQECIAVIDPAEAATGNVYMGRGNAWRGDRYGDAARAIRERVEADRLIAHSTKETS